MKKLMGIIPCLLTVLFLSPASAQGQNNPEPPHKLHGKALKAKMAEIQLIKGFPKRPYQKLEPIWASKGSMKSTLKDLRKQAAKEGADAVIDIRVKTEKLRSVNYDPGFWGGPGWYGGGYPYGGYWGGMGYWGGYTQASTYLQPVVQGWAVKWTGPGPETGESQMISESELESPEPPKNEPLEQQVEDAPATQADIPK